jgi:hypothetical protein
MIKSDPKITFTLFLILLVALHISFIPTAHAQTSMSNSSFILRFPNLNSFAGKPSNSQFKLGITGGQTAPGLYSGTNYKVRAGFQYIKSIIPFSFTISSIFIDFGPITPGAPVTRTNTLTVSNGSAYGYTVLARENHPLQVEQSGATIPDTTCDSGTCNEQVASAWSSLTTFGFGYRCDNLSGTDCQSGFSNPLNYRQFASSESGELAQPVMRGVNVGRNIEGQITYKVNVSSTQAPGAYENFITYIALPSI